MAKPLPSTLTDLRVIRQNHRFATYEAKLDGRRVFVKRALLPALHKSIEAELYGLRLFGELQQTGQLPFRVPEVVLSGADYLATSWAQGKAMPFEPSPTKTDSSMALMAELYASIDRASALQASLSTKFATPDARGTNEADRLAKRLRSVEWKHVIPKSEVTKALQRVDETLDQWIPRSHVGGHENLTVGGQESDG